MMMMMIMMMMMRRRPARWRAATTSAVCLTACSGTRRSPAPRRPALPSSCTRSSESSSPSGCRRSSAWGRPCSGPGRCLQPRHRCRRPLCFSSSSSVQHLLVTHDISRSAKEEHVSARYKFTLWPGMRLSHIPLVYCMITFC